MKSTRLLLTLFLLMTVMTEARSAVPYEERTDTVAEKLRMLTEAYAAGDDDLALSLAASLRETIHFEKNEDFATAPAQLTLDDIVAVADLPKSWARWAQGWQHARVVTLDEAAGIERRGEPVDVRVAFPAGQLVDLHREVRVVRVDPSSKRLIEITSQVYGIERTPQGLVAHVVFLADVEADAKATYLILHNNPNAERPEYPSDLQVSGEGYDLDIDSRHYTAHLSGQMGQLERVVYKRQHGLELYAGGKGHGEPPTIDWSNDYVDAEHFQKLRIRSWPQAPDYEVVRGPLVVQVRRWGFPASPLHPVFAPSRVLVDQTYTFYAGADYFLKDGTMRVVKDVEISAMRDDEWVLSGYSFSDMVWFDADGKMHEGAVPGEHANDLWGVGFHHKDSRDAFVVLWLEHEAEGLDKLHHNGSPTLHYFHHGQLWSRYPAGPQTQLQAGTWIRNHNAYLVAPWPEQDAAGTIERVRRRLKTPLQATAMAAPKRDGGIEGEGMLARRGEVPQMGPAKAAIWEALRLVQDEQFYSIDANIVDFGYVYDVQLFGDVVKVVVTMPHRGRPVWQFIEDHGGGRVSVGIRERLLALEGVRDVILEHTWYPAWDITRVTESGRHTIGLPPTAIQPKAGE